MDWRTCRSQTDLLTRKLRNQPGLADVATGFRSNTPQLYLDIDRTKAVALGVAFEDVNQTLSMFLGSLYVNSFNQFGRHWQVTVQAEGEYRDRIEDLNLFQVRNKWGEMVPLGTLVNVNQVKSDRAVRSSSRAITSTRPRRSPGTCYRGSARETPSRPSTKRPVRACRSR